MTKPLVLVSHAPPDDIRNIEWRSEFAPYDPDRTDIHAPPGEMSYVLHLIERKFLNVRQDQLSLIWKKSTECLYSMKQYIYRKQGYLSHHQFSSY